MIRSHGLISQSNSEFCWNEPTRADSIVQLSRQAKPVAELLRDRTGSLLDIGARSGPALESRPSEVDIYARDLDGEHDYRIDLEGALPIPDKTFDCVVAMDVLEHVDGFHAAFREGLRVSRRWVVIGLPNMGSFVHRLSMVFAGRPATAKYDSRCPHARSSSMVFEARRRGSLHGKCRSRG